MLKLHLFCICIISFPPSNQASGMHKKLSPGISLYKWEEREIALTWWDNDSFCSLFFHFTCAQVTVATLKRKPADHIWLNTIFKVCHQTVDWSVYVLSIFFPFIWFKSLIPYSHMKKSVFYDFAWFHQPAVLATLQTQIFIELT